jgi:peptidoglycan/xylan/chitin deacetylase (PgdA/CDA1 family)
MTAGDIREWAERGIEIGSHGRTHRSLPSCTDAELEDELRGSRAALEAIVGKPVDAFAYPFGDTDDRVERAALGAYGLAFSLETGLNTLRTPPGRMRRSIVRPRDGAADFACRVGLGWNPIDAARDRLRRT